MMAEVSYREHLPALLPFLRGSGCTLPANAVMLAAMAARLVTFELQCSAVKRGGEMVAGPAREAWRITPLGRRVLRAHARDARGLT